MPEFLTVWSKISLLGIFYNNYNELIFIEHSPYIELNASNVLPPGCPKRTLWGRYCHWPHFMGGENGPGSPHRKKGNQDSNAGGLTLGPYFRVCEWEAICLLPSSQGFVYTLKFERCWPAFHSLPQIFIPFLKGRPQGHSSKPCRQGPAFWQMPHWWREARQTTDKERIIKVLFKMPFPCFLPRLTASESLRADLGSLYLTRLFKGSLKFKRFSLVLLRDKSERETPALSYFAHCLSP